MEYEQRGEDACLRKGHRVNRYHLEVVISGELTRSMGERHVIYNQSPWRRRTRENLIATVCDVGT